jgi:hypothetical protein
MGKYADALKRINDIAEATDGVAKEMKGEADSSFVRRKMDFAATKAKGFLKAVVDAVDGENKDNSANDEAMRLITMLLVSDALEGLFASLGNSDDD